MPKTKLHYIGAKDGCRTVLMLVKCRNTNNLFVAIRSVFIAVLISADASKCGDVINQHVQQNRPIYSVVARNGRFGFECADSAEMRRFTKSNSEIFHPLDRCHLSVDNPVLINGYVNSSVDSLNFIFCDEFGRCVTIDSEQVSSVQYLQLEFPESRPNESLGVLIHLIPAIIVVGLAIYFAQGLKTL